MSLLVSAYFAASLDGYIAKEDGSLDWLDTANKCIPEGEDCGFQAFMDTVDCMVMGRKTFQKVLSFGQWIYGDIPVIVLSHQTHDLPPTVPNTVSYSSEPPKELCSRLECQGYRHLYVDGGMTIRGFLTEGKLNEMITTIIPVVLGGGISPFSPLPVEVSLTLLGVQEFDFGFVQIRYAVASYTGK